MNNTSSKERILKKIRDALIHSTPEPFTQIEGSEIYKPVTDTLEIRFAEEFTKINGQFVYCESQTELINAFSTLSIEKKWNKLVAWEDELLKIFNENSFSGISSDTNIEDADVGITLCESLIARTGSILMCSQQSSGRALSVFPPVHICVAFTDQLVDDIRDALNLLKEKYPDQTPSMINLITGPSRTADIEKTLVLGAHGPKEIFVFLVERVLNPES